MSFRVFLHQGAARSLSKLQESMRDRIKKAMRQLEDSPEVRGEQIRPTDFWRIRVGDYRVIYEIDYQSRRVIVLYIGHRKNVYDSFSRFL